VDIEEIVIQGKKQGQLGGVTINYFLPYPLEQLWYVLPDGSVVNVPTKVRKLLCGSGGKKARGDSKQPG
jgi:hypothetical protein